VDSVWGEATLRKTTAQRSGEAVSKNGNLPRDTPHARVSVSCVLEASVLNERVTELAEGLLGSTF